MIALKKHNWLLLSIMLLAGTMSCRFSSSPGHDSDKLNTGNHHAVPVIFDTDISEDYDDVGAMGMLHALADLGEIKILATVASNKAPLVVPCIDVINTYFGRPDLPIGAPKSAGVNRAPKELKWPDSLAANFPHTYKSTDQAPDAVKIYREILANEPDTSVVIVTVGFLTNISDLLKSGPDDISPLSGKELAAKKVKHWVAMAGRFPEGLEYNVRMDSLASEYAINHWPRPIIFSGFEIGVRVLTGLILIEEGPKESPVTMAYALSIPQRYYDTNGRMSWDQTALLVAARGFEPYYDTEHGLFITNPDGSNKWKADPNGPHIRLIEKMPPDSVAYIIETLMMHTPI